jgi:hypothetical protein
MNYELKGKCGIEFVKESLKRTFGILVSKNPPKKRQGILAVVIRISRIKINSGFSRLLQTSKLFL